MESNPLPTPAAHESFAVYQREAHKFAGTMPDRDRVFMACLGLAGEAGEVVDELKKVHFHAKPYDRAKLVRELGDVLWYVAELATAHDIDLQEVPFVNLAKLRTRHGGETFKPHAEQKRDEPRTGGVVNTQPPAEGFPPSCDVPKPGTGALDIIMPQSADVVVHSTRSPLTPREQAQTESRTHRVPLRPPTAVVHGSCILASPEATEVDRERCRDETRAQLVDAHKMLDRLGAPGGPKSGSVRERLFYLIERRGWTPNVRNPWGDDVVPWLSPLEVKGQPIAPAFAASALRDGLLDPSTVTIDGHKLADVVDFLRHARPFFRQAALTCFVEGLKAQTVVPAFAWEAFANAAAMLFGRQPEPDEQPPRPHFEQPGER